MGRPAPNCNEKYRYSKEMKWLVERPNVRGKGGDGVVNLNHIFSLFFAGPPRIQEFGSLINDETFPPFRAV